MHYHLLASSFDEFVRSMVGACGLEKLGRIDRDTKKIQRHRIVLGVQLSKKGILYSLMFVCHMII